MGILTRIWAFLAVILATSFGSVATHHGVRTAQVPTGQYSSGSIGSTTAQISLTVTNSAGALNQSAWEPEPSGFAQSITGVETPIPAPPGMLQSTVDEGYTRDAKNAYYQGQPLPNVDLATFQVVSINPELTSWAKDRNQVYCGASVLTGADPANFTPVLVQDINDYDSGYGKDDRYIYAGCDGIVPNADPLTFDALDPYSDNGGYAKDATHVWWILEPGGDPQGSWPLSIALVQGADPRTFNLNATSPATIDASDENHDYMFGQIVH